MEAIAVFLVVLFVTILIGLPIGFGVGLTTVAMMYFLGMQNMMMIARHLITGVDIYTLPAIPFFMLAGEIMNRSGIVMLICGTAMALTWYLATAQVPQEMTRFMLNVTENRYVFLLILNVLLFVVGAVIDLTPALFLLVPILLPIYLILFLVVLMITYVTPVVLWLPSLF